MVMDNMTGMVGRATIGTTFMHRNTQTFLGSLHLTIGGVVVVGIEILDSTIGMRVDRGAVYLRGPQDKMLDLRRMISGGIQRIIGTVDCLVRLDLRVIRALSEFVCPLRGTDHRDAQQTRDEMMIREMRITVMVMSSAEEMVAELEATIFTEGINGSLATRPSLGTATAAIQQARLMAGETVGTMVTFVVTVSTMVTRLGECSRNRYK